MKIDAGAYSSKGSVRQHNEDSFLVAGETGGVGLEDSFAVFSGTTEDPCLFIVADGMGGHNAGDMASSFVVKKLIETVVPRQKLDADVIETAIKSIHTQLLAEGEQRGTPNMGSTLAGIFLQKGNSGYCNAGDSRVYRLRGGFIQQLSHDDSLSGIIPGAAKNIITNAIGAGLSNIKVECRFSEFIAAGGDVFLLCSDGVHGFLSDDELEQMLLLKQRPAEIAQSIVKEAIANNSDDNCTAVVVKILETGDNNV